MSVGVRRIARVAAWPAMGLVYAGWFYLYVVSPALAIVLPGVVLLVVLGVWQLGRRRTRRRLLEEEFR